MPRQLWIADKLRQYGLTVVEQPGWQTRGSTSFNPRGLVNHHTASRRGADTPSLRVVINGRSDLPGPLCHVLLARSGTCHVIAAGRANHAGRGWWKGLTGNSSVLGIEAENDGIGEPWPTAQLNAFILASAALLDGIGADTEMLCGHKEWAPGRKIDPTGIEMDQFRRQVDDARTTGGTPMSDRSAEIREAQIKLTNEGGTRFYTGDIDEDFGPLSLDAVHKAVNQANEADQHLATIADLERQLEQAIDTQLDSEGDLREQARIGRAFSELVHDTLTDEDTP